MGHTQLGHYREAAISATPFRRKWEQMLRLLVIFGLMAAGVSHVLGAPPEGDAATIINSGSTNRTGFRIVVDNTPQSPKRSRASPTKP
jgi:hypothetical protein